MEKINKREADSDPALPDMDEQAREDELKKFDAEMLNVIRVSLPRIFRLNELLAPYFWNNIPDGLRGMTEERFRSQVERGDIVGVSTLPTANGPQRYMKA